MEAKGDTADVENWSMFQVKYVEFIEDAFGALPEYDAQLKVAKALEEPIRLRRFQEEVQAGLAGLTGFEEVDEKEIPNPGAILPGVVLTDGVWSALSSGTQQAIREHLRVLSICCMMEATPLGSDGAKPAWMEDMMKEMKAKWESVDMSDLMKKFSSFFATMGSDTTGTGTGTGTGDEKDQEKQGFSLPKLPERFLKGQLAKLAQEIVKDITPEDLGITPEQIAECEKNPSNAFQMLFTTFTKNPGSLQRTVAKIGKRLQQKVLSGAIRPQEIAREAEELMKEFAGNASFVDMMEGLKGAFGMEDMETARSAGRESSARMSIVRDRLRKKLEEKQKAAVAATTPSGNGSKGPKKKK
jgi:hypothetical protein